MKMAHSDSPNHPVEVDAERAALLKASGWVEQSADKPAGNASLAEWAEYATALGATEDDLHGMTRDEVRDTYGK